MDRKTDIKIEVWQSGWRIRDLSEKSGICYYKLIKILNGYQPFLPEEEALVRRVLAERRVEVGI